MAIFDLPGKSLITPFHSTTPVHLSARQLC